MKKAPKRWLCLLLTAMMLAGLYTAPAVAEKTADDYNIGFRATVSVTKDDGSEVLGGGPDECRDWWRGLPQDINNYFIMSTAGRWGWNYTVAKEDLPVNVTYDYGIKPAAISQITLAEALKNTDLAEGGRYTKVELQYFNGTDWTTIVPAAGNGYTVNTDNSVSLDWSAPTRTDTLEGSKLDLIDVNLGNRYVSDKFRVRILDGNENGGCWTQIAIDEILMYGQEADGDGIAANGDAYLNALGEKAAAEAKKMADANTIVAAQAMVSTMASASRKAVLTEELSTLAEKPWTNLALDATASDASNSAGTAMLNDLDTAGDSDHSWHLAANTAEESAWFKYSYGKKVKIHRIELGARTIENAITDVDVYAVNNGTETKVGSYNLKNHYGRVPWNYMYTDGSAFKTEAKTALESEGCIKYADIFWSDFGVIDIDGGVVCDELKVVVKEVNDGFASHEAQCSECITWGTEATEPAVAYDDYNIGYDAAVTVKDTSGNAVPAGYNGENWWRAGIQSINDYFVHSDPNYWGYSYTINPSSLPVNVDFDYGLKPANIGKITLAETLRSADEINTGRYTKVLLQYFNGIDWATITPAAGTGYTVNSDNTVSLDWANKARSEALVGTAQLDFIDINLGSRYVADKFRVQILEATGNGNAWGEFGIDEILMYGVEADSTAIGANSDAYLNALGEKAAAEAKQMADADTIAAAQALVASMKDESRKAALKAELDALAANPWINLGLEATVSDGVNGSTVSNLNDGTIIGTSDKTWTLPAGTAAEKAWFQYDYGRKVSINRVDFGCRVVNNALKDIEIYAVNGETETKIDSYTLDFNRVPESGLFNKETEFAKEAFARFEAKGQIDTNTGALEYSDFCSINFTTAVQCEKMKIVVKDVKDGFASHQADCTECRTWGTKVREVVTDYDDYNIGYEAEVSVKDTSGIAVSAGVNGGYGYSWWRTGVQDINNYFVHGTAGVWGYNYTINPDKLPVNVDFDYGLTPANIGKITLASAMASDTEINKGRYTKIKLSYFNGTDWTTITPAAGTGYTVNSDNTISLDWANKNRRENADSGVVDFIDVNLGARYVSDKFRVQILEATGNGDCWGEFNIAEILMYGVAASEDDVYYSGAAYVNALGEKAVEKAKKMADSDTIAAAQTLVKQMPDEERKTVLTAELAALAENPWTNLALAATVSDGLGVSTVSNLNDGNTVGTSDKTWTMAGDTAEDKSWFKYDYGKAVTINRIDIGARNVKNAITKIDVYASLNGSETKVGTYTLSSNRVPEKAFYKTEENLSKEAFAYFTDKGLLDSTGEVQYSEFDSVVFESSIVCDSLKIVVQGVTSGFRTTDKTEFNDAPVEAQCTECRTWGTVGENASYNYTETNQAFKMPVSMYDQSGNEVKASDVDGYRNWSTEYVTDFSIYEADWYDTAFDYTKLPFFVEIDYQGDLVEINRAMLSSTRNGRNGGLVQGGKFQMFDGAQWKDISLAQTQDEGITVTDGVNFTLDWEKPSIYDQTEDDYKAYYHMDVKFAEPVLGFKLRLLVTAAGNDGGTFHIDELMTWGWTPVQADIDSRENAADIIAKKNTYLLDLAFTNPTQKNVDAATAIIKNMSAEDKELYTKALGKLGVWDKLSAAGSAGSGNYPDGLTDGKFSEASQRWDSTNTTIDEKSWVQINFASPTQMSKLRLAERYFPVALTKVNVYAKVGDELIPIYLNQTLGFANAPELNWFTSHPGAQFDTWAKQAYVDNNMIRDDGGELETAAWVELDFPSDVTCDAIRIQILDAERGWGGYGLAELEAIGKTAAESNVFAMETGVKCADDDSDTTSLTAVKSRGGYFIANLGNPDSKTKEVTMLVVYYKDGTVISTDSKVVNLPTKSYHVNQKLDLNFDGLRANCDTIKCYVWSEVGSEETARGTNTAIELK